MFSVRIRLPVGHSRPTLVNYGRHGPAAAFIIVVIVSLLLRSGSSRLAAPCSSEDGSPGCGAGIRGRRCCANTGAGNVARIPPRSQVLDVSRVVQAAAVLEGRRVGFPSVGVCAAAPGGGRASARLLLGALGHVKGLADGLCGAIGDAWQEKKTY